MIERGLRYSALGLFLLLTIATLVVSGYGIESLNIMQVFDSDEFRIAGMVQGHLQTRNLDPHGYFNYGHLYESIAYYGLRFFERFGWNVDIQLIGSFLRLLSLSFALVSSALLSRLVVQLGLSWTWGLLGGVAFLAMPDFIFYARTIHPDTLQTALVIASLLIAARKSDLRHAIAAAALAGLAFGTKYSGLFVLPFAVLPYTLSVLSEPTRWNDRTFKKIAVLGAIALGVFLLLYFLSNPYAVRHPRGAYSGFQFERNHVATGHGKVEPKNPLLWIDPLIYELGGFSLLVLVLALVGETLILFRTWRKTSGFREFFSSQTNRNEVTLLSYVAVCTATLFLTVRMREARYTFHVMPIAFALALLPIDRVAARMSRTMQGPLGNSAGAVKSVIALLLLVYSVSQTSRALARMESPTRKPLSPALAAGEFLSENFAKDTQILADFYTFISPKFQRAKIVWGFTAEDVQKLQPRILIFNRPMSGRWAWKKQGTRLGDLNLNVDSSYGERASQHVAFLRNIFAENSEWETVFENPETVVLSRKKQAIPTSTSTTGALDARDIKSR